MRHLQIRWFIMEKSHQKWMRTGCTPMTQESSGQPPIECLPCSFIASTRVAWTHLSAISVAAYRQVLCGQHPPVAAVVSWPIRLGRDCWKSMTFIWKDHFLYLKRLKYPLLKWCHTTWRELSQSCVIFGVHSLWIQTLSQKVVNLLIVNYIPHFLRRYGWIHRDWYSTHFPWFWWSILSGYVKR